MNHEEIQARRAAIKVGDVIYSPEYGYNHPVLSKLTVTKVTPKQIVCGKVRFWKFTTDRVGRTTEVFYSRGGGNYYLPDELYHGDKGPTYAERYVQLGEEERERVARMELHKRITKLNYKHLPIEVLHQIVALIEPYEALDAKRKQFMAGS